MIVVCYLLSHLMQLKALPVHLRENFIRSNTTSCQYYSTRSWKILEQTKRKVVLTNGVIEVKGYIFK